MEIFNFIEIYLNGKRWRGIGYKYKSSKEYEINYGKGFIKEYNYDGKLKFEGEYLTGKRHGKDKEYYEKDSKLKFEGECLNCLRNGKGKEYYKGYYKEDSWLKFEEEYLNDEKNGKGKEYFSDGQIQFDDENLNGIKLNGNIKE